MSAKRSIYICFLSVFIDMLGVSVVLPIVPYLALEFKASPSEIGVLYAAYAAAQMISTPITGKLSDKFGRRPLLLLSLIGSASGFFVQGLANNYGVFVLGRVVAGSFGGSIPIAQAYIADVVPENDRPRYFAMLGSIITIAFMFGPGIGAGLSQFTLQTPMLVGSVISLMGAVLAFFAFTEKPINNDKSQASSPHPATQDSAAEIDKTSVTQGRQRGLSSEDAQTHHPHDVESAATRSKVLAQEEEKDSEAAKIDYHGSKQYLHLIKMMWLVSFCGVLGFSAYLYFFGLYIFDLYTYTSLEYGFISMATSVFCVFVQIVIFPKFVSRFGKHGTGVIGNCLQSAGLILLSFLSSDVNSFGGLPLMVISLMLLGVGFSFFTPATTSILSRYASKKHQGSVLGISQALQALSRTVGPLIYGGVYSESASAVFVIACAVSVLGAAVNFLVLIANRKLPEHVGQEESNEKKAVPHEINVDLLSSEDVVLLQNELSKAIDLLDRYHRLEKAYGKTLDELEAITDACHTATHATR